VAVMYAGRVVETADVAALFRAPAHPYTRGLLACVPRMGAGQAGTRLAAIPGQIASPLAPPPGCAFSPRCALAGADCAATMPALRATAPGHAARCLRADAA
jgi:peptide/nickel transport system ATP-binding protein